jgi:hypothetical protein
MFVHNFPNMGVISGLKQAGITWSITTMNRRQAEHYAALVKRCLDQHVSFDVTEQAEQAWLAVLEEKAMKDDTFLRECTPGYYNNEGRNQRDSIWLSNYGGGPFEYMDILRDWIGSDLVAGVRPIDANFGNNDELIPGGNATVAKIASIVIHGQVLGTPAATNGLDHFGFVAQQVGSFRVGNTSFDLTPGAGDDLAGLVVGATADVRVREVS